MKFLSSTKGLVLALIGWWLVMLFVRVVYLDSIPPVISHDEIYYVAQAKSLAIQGTDPSGTWRPWQLTAAHPLYAELPGVMMAPAAWIWRDSPVAAAKITSALIGSLIPLLLAGIVWTLFQKKNVAIATLLIASLNPWLFQFSRLGFDSLLSIFFYLAGILTFLHCRSWHRLWSVPLFVLGFYQYQGLKLILPLIVIALAWYVLAISWHRSHTWLSNLKANKVPLVFAGILALFMIGFWLRLQGQVTAGRVGDLIFFANDHLAAQVNLERQVALDNPWQSLFTNKLTVLRNELATRYLASFNPHELFIRLDSRRNPFGVWSRGIFHLIDLPLLLIGLVVMWRSSKHRLAAILVTGLMLIGPLPNAVQSQDIWIALRSGFFFMWLIVVMAMGAVWWWQRGRLAKATLISFYLICVSQFMYEYFYRYPVYATQGNYFAERVLSSYIARQPSKMMMVLVDEAEFVFYEVLVYNNLIRSEKMTQVNQAFQSGVLTIDQVTINTDCLDPSLLDGQTTIITGSSTQVCPGSSPLSETTSQIGIPSLLDSGQIFKIYGDELCQGYGLPRFANLKQNLLAVEKLSDEQFCQVFFTEN